MTADDLDRLCSEYADREQRLAGSDIYSPFNKANLFAIQQRQRETLALLRQKGFYPLSEKAILELGCGTGGVLLEYLTYGANPNRLHGTDLLSQRVEQAHARLSHLPLTCADGQALPYRRNSFDLVLQYTVFTSVLDEEVKANLAGEMLRVLRPGGMILWYDFWLNPTNPQTEGIRPSEIRSLFPGCDVEFRRITLAPPLARRLVPISWVMAFLLEKLRVFNSHYLVAIRPPS
jgi:ubiquinone/menaquinone biosynthesis C-methylase UbiE